MNAALVTAHLPKLGQCFSLVHSWKIFLLVLALGVGQTVLAVYGGYLSALTLDVRARRAHYRTLSLVGVFLIGLTLVLGFINDTSQFESQNEAELARKNQQAVQQKLDSSQEALRNVYASVEALKATLPKSKSESGLSEQVHNRELGRKLDILQQTIVTALNDPQRIGVPTHAVSLTPAPSTPQIPREATLGGAHDKVTRCYDSLSTFDSNRRAALERTVQDLLLPLRMGHGTWPLRVPPTVQQGVAEADQRSRADFLKQIPDIEVARGASNRELHRTQQLITEDEKRYQEAKSYALVPYHPSENAGEINEQQQKFLGMLNYLRESKEELEKAGHF